MQRTAFVIVSVLAIALTAFASSASAAGVETPVVGGTVVEPGAFPDVVAVLGADGSLCSGTLLTADLVLTAGHCIEGEPIEVIIGSVDLSRPDGDRRRVQWSKAYPQWQDTYDVGVVMLEHPVFAKPRPVAQSCGARDRFKVGLPLQLVGFGLTTKAGTGDNTRLHRAVLPLVDPTCAMDPSCMPAVAPGGEFIAGGRGTDACFGDSGGPVYIETGKGLALIGVVSRGLVSWTEPCSSGGVYVRADKVVAWIERVSGRKLERAACDRPGDEGGVADDGGCNAGGAMESGFAVYYALLVFAGLRMSRRRRAAGASTAGG
ncbi:MAG TPA: trypsin-like serine protease [Kofleriaceae bacterium]